MEMKMGLRPGKRQDGSYWMDWLSDERQLRMWCRDRFSYPLTREQLDTYYDELEADESAWGLTALDEAGRPVGSLRMALADYEAKSIHLGFIIVDPALRGQGLGQRMVSMAVKYAVELLGMKRITLKVFDCNEQARKCYEKAGFREEAHTAGEFAYGQEQWGNSLMAYSADVTACP